MGTGLGSVDAAAFVNAWGNTADIPANQTAITATADNTTILLSGSVALTISVNASVGAAVPTGTVYVNLGNTPTPESTLPGELLLGTATLGQSGRAAASAMLRIYAGQLNVGDNTLTITYAGDAQFNGNSTTITIHVDLPTTNSAVIPLVHPLYYHLEISTDTECAAEFFRISMGVRNRPDGRGGRGNHAYHVQREWL